MMKPAERVLIQTSDGECCGSLVLRSLNNACYLDRAEPLHRNAKRGGHLRLCWKGWEPWVLRLPHRLRWHVEADKEHGMSLHTLLVLLPALVAGRRAVQMTHGYT